VETRAPLPVVIFFHAEDDNPTGVEKRTGLRKLGGQVNLTGDPAHAGFLVLAPQGRALQGKPGSQFDTVATGPDNVDIAAVDHFLGELSSRGLVDRARVYALGMSAGGHMAATYAMVRADRVAAFATFAADAPPAAWACPGPPPPAMVLYRACDAVVPCESVERWLRARDAQSAETPYLRLGEDGRDEPHCALRRRCPEAKGRVHHNRWPRPRENDVLRFFAGHALAVQPERVRPPTSTTD
jgi:poly(3-hydroxybutyrate) depolymerase